MALVDLIGGGAVAPPDRGYQAYVEIVTGAGESPLSKADWLAMWNTGKYFPRDNPESPAWLAGDFIAMSETRAHNGSLWQALQPSQGIAPGSNAEYWALLLQGPSTVTFQSGIHDTTAGRGLLAGAYGWGQPGNQQTAKLLSEALSSGVHQFASTDPENPISTGGAVLVIRYGASWLTQIVFGANSTVAFIRRSQDNGVTWSTWVPLIPTYGSNANGSYVRFADGTQLCWNRIDSQAIAISTATGTVFNDTAQPAISFPASFTVAPSVQVNLRGNSTWASVSAVTASSFTPVFFAATSTTGTQVLYWMAVGRWF
ncbi:pyocin knob domain-containing protein [Salipiger sp. H15]|uniref:Pyocin knob domain-containing protein n=1 Tax=Alloyangia sp. H15 TaxID=3029062 RepID=A0AAU8AG34_9RHOB